ncbi:protein CYCLOPS [Ziziphus jujuba]|uniref:Protein CYCLOPS n=1 Tax=Ziziphus jujuba TaxID=326968 RepID=A0A6P4APU2_ZIZJJ|nr:protein CYCLOPS [Ziziphus jujuba]
MFIDGNKGNSANDSSLKPGNIEQNQNSFQTPTLPRSEGEKNFMDMEGRGLSDLYRDPSEELFLRSYMESLPGPNMDMLGFKNLSQNLRADSEELFKSWLTNGENNGYNSPSIALRTRQGSRRISTELATLSSQQQSGVLQKRKSNDILYPQNNAMADDIPGNVNDHSIRNATERGVQASELYLAKVWFHSSQPMTRSRSSELRRRYAAMQNVQTPVGLEGLHDISANGANAMKQEFAYSNVFSDPSMCEMPNQLDTFMSPSNSSSSTFNTQPNDMDKISSVVSMLKGTLERKKRSNQIEKEVLEDDSSNGLFPIPEVIVNTNFHQAQRNQIHEKPPTFYEVSPLQIKDHGVIHTVDGSMDLELEGFVNSNPIQSSRVSQEPSQSESSAAAPVVSSGIDACDGPSNSSQTLGACESSRKQTRNRRTETGSRAKDIRERIIDNLKDDRKRATLVRHGSVTSAVSVIKEDATKKRRVERSRKMAEAKERNLTPAIPSDMQSVLKRCETLEKEVRSLKLNLSFMNRKDSEQTKQIEDLQKQNEDLLEEKECLIEEIKRMISEPGNI